MGTMQKSQGDGLLFLGREIYLAESVVWCNEEVTGVLLVMMKSSTPRAQKTEKGQ